MNASERAPPWSRYFARTLDILIWTAPFTFLMMWLAASLSLPISFDRYTTSTVATLIALPPALAIDALILAWSSTTIGKWLAGVRVEATGAAAVSVKMALVRNLNVYIRGLAAGIPVLALLTTLLSYRRVKSGRETGWDEAAHTAVVSVGAGVKRNLITLGAILILAFSFGWLCVMFHLLKSDVY